MPGQYNTIRDAKTGRLRRMSGSEAAQYMPIDSPPPPGNQPPPLPPAHDQDAADAAFMQRHAEPPPLPPGNQPPPLPPAHDQDAADAAFMQRHAEPPPLPPGPSAPTPPVEPLAEGVRGAAAGASTGMAGGPAGAAVGATVGFLASTIGASQRSTPIASLEGGAAGGGNEIQRALQQMVDIHRTFTQVGTKAEGSRV